MVFISSIFRNSYALMGRAFLLRQFTSSRFILIVVMIYCVMPKVLRWLLDIYLLSPLKTKQRKKMKRMIQIKLNRGGLRKIEYRIEFIESFWYLEHIHV